MHLMHSTVFTMNLMLSIGKKKHNKAQFDFYKCKKHCRYDRFSEITIHSMPHDLMLAQVVHSKKGVASVLLVQDDSALQ